MIKQNHILRFENFSKFDNIIHGFSTSFFGSLRPSHLGFQQSLEKFSKALSIDKQNLVRMHQMHTNRVYWTTTKNYGQAIQDTDGLITDEKHVFLGIISADCIPLFFYDPKKQFVAVVHAGWRGLFSEIIKNAVNEMKKKGSNPKDLIVGIGPCIGVCCYDILKGRAEMFTTKFPDWKQFIEERDSKLFLNLSGIAKYQLSLLGILEKNIENADYCTFDHKDLYSYRREGEDFGEMMGVIGLV